MQSRVREEQIEKSKFLFDWINFEKMCMNPKPFTVQSLLGHTATAHTLIDNGCMNYGVVSEGFVKKHQLPTINIPPRPARGATGTEVQITRVVRTCLDIDTHSEKGAYFYVLPDQLGYDLILGLAWMQHHDALMETKRGRLYLRTTGVRIHAQEKKTLPVMDVVEISFLAMGRFINRSQHTKKNSQGTQIFAVSMADIQKALEVKKKADPRTVVPKQYHHYLDLFEPRKAEELPPHRGKQIDHTIELVQKDGKEPEVPWGPLYNMTAEELIVLRKTLTDLLDKGFIRVSHSSAAAPVLFVRKPGGGLRFCVDYRALNAITKKDRYPLPLIHETLNQIGRAKWFTKLDVSAAFHKIRITMGQEWLTAFRTRYGLYEWMVTPFGLANAPSTFQKYINWALREYLDEFCSAYIDDVLIYTDGPLEQHQEHVRKTLQKLSDAGLYLDVNKCEFERQETKYLGFIVRAGEGIRMDPEKVQAIKEWAPPTTVKGVRSFLGFANFYRQFIRNFSQIVRPLNKLTHKDTTFQWTDQCQQNFDLLKEMFSTEPILATFDSTRTTVVETDSSGYNTGGVLSQYDDKGLLRPCAYFSKRNAPAECNYPIYDKELLAVVRCLEAWDAELRSVEQFQVVTDHKNLEYFFTPRKLTERHVRWSLFLSRFNFQLCYREGTANQRADALSRRDQDMPADQDERVKSRTIQLLKEPEKTTGIATICPVQILPLDQPTTAVYETTEVDWTEARDTDLEYQEAVQCLQQGNRQFPSHLGLKVSVAECCTDNAGFMLFRGRRWAPNHEPLRTKLLGTAHTSLLTGHPGREETYTVLSREFFWPNMAKDVRKFVRNCDVCGRTKAWRDKKKGALKPLPVPDRPWQEVSMDFIVELPKSEGCTNLLVITDRLTKGVILVPMKKIDAEQTAWAIIRHLIGRHGFPRAITSDRGTQFANHMWRRVCSLLNIIRRISTAYHPETDGSTERMNSVIETYLRTYIAYGQEDWNKLLPMAELALNCRTATSTGISPFYLSHGYHPSPFPVSEDHEDLMDRPPRSPIQQGEAIVRTLGEALDWAQAAMAYSQQEAERQANRQREPAPNYKVGDHVWLNLKNIRTNRPCKKLDWKNAKFVVTETIGSHAVRLNTPPGVHPVFHVNLLRLANQDPFPSQYSDDSQPPAVMVDDHEEWVVERIVNEHRTRQGRGWRVQYEVKWLGYPETNWELASALEETTALDEWLARTEPYRRPDGTLDNLQMA